MAAFQGEEPYNHAEEVVDVSASYFGSPGLTITYNPTTGGFRARNGRIKKISITVESQTGETFTITRHPNGVYQGDSWWTQVTRRR